MTRETGRRGEWGRLGTLVACLGTATVIVGGNAASWSAPAQPPLALIGSTVALAVVLYACALAFRHVRNAVRGRVGGPGRPPRRSF